MPASSTRTGTTITAAAAAFAASLVVPTAVHAMMENLSGAWTGKGTAYVRNLGDIRAGCRFNVVESASSLNMDGSCGVGPLRGNLGLRLNIDASGSVTGTYTGSRSGPARLSGKIQGDALVMSIRWNKPVNGDRTAQMVLRRTGANSFSQTVTDKIDGSPQRTSNFTFSRR